jgi:pimeloyl-ACP methyl ester carboxylesterase
MSHNSGTDTPAVVVFHGICSGWSYYSKLILQLCSRKRRVILFDYDCVKLNSMVFEVPGAVDVATSIRAIMQCHQCEKISIVSHSWGTFWAGWMVRLHPQVVVSVTMIDPIALTVVFPETTYFILYKPVKTFQDVLVSYFVRNDLTISNTLHRNFAWYNVALRFDDIAPHIGVNVAISGKDELMHPPVLMELLQIHSEKRASIKAAPIKSILWDEFEHGMGILDDDAIVSIVEQSCSIEEQCISLF